MVSGTQSAVLLLGFNRPGHTRAVLSKLKIARPPRLYFSVDGPRPDQKSDSENCQNVRDLASEVTWPCELLTRFQPANLGLAENTVSSIEWFLDSEPEGIVLEDDGVPHGSFFPYCDSLLERYRDDYSVAHISGTSFFPRRFHRESADYSIVRSANAWGFGIWGRAWGPFYDRYRDPGWRGSFDELLEGVPFKKRGEKFWKGVIGSIRSGEIDSWAYLWQLFLWQEGLRAIMPAVNLVENIGFSAESTHTTKKPIVREFHPKSDELRLPLRHPTPAQQSLHLDFLYQWLFVGAFGSKFRSLGRLLFAAENRVSILLRKLGRSKKSTLEERRF